MIYTTEKRDQILKHISEYVLDPVVCRELGEPLLFKVGDVFGFYEDEQKDVKAFFCVSIKAERAFLRYVYVRPNERGNGIFGRLIEEVESLCKEAGISQITATSTNTALPLYLKKGYSIKKSHVNYHNIQKQL